MKSVLATTVLSMTLLAGASASAAVWTENKQWTKEWEDQYADWVENSFNEDVFTHGKYKDTGTDCADAVYFSRLIFAYENKLPFVIKDPTGGGSKITNQMSRFDSVKDESSRLKRFMDYVGGVVGTKSLPNDSYPVAIRRDLVRPGTIWSRPRITRETIFSRFFGGQVSEDPGHAELVKSVEETGAVNLIGSTVPKAVRKLLTTSSLIFMPEERGTGFRNWIQPNQYGQSEESLPGYSLEQFTMGKSQSTTDFNSESGGGMQHNTSRNITTWTEQVQSKLALRAESSGEANARTAKNVCALVTARIDVIKMAEARRKSLGGACMNADDYDAHSTPSRDKRIESTLKSLASSAGGFGLMASQRIKKAKSYLDQCPDLEIAPGKRVSMYDFAVAALSGNVSSDPNDSLEARWGLANKTSTCPKYE
jgi:hypothetical protein